MSKRLLKAIGAGLCVPVFLIVYFSLPAEIMFYVSVAVAVGVISIGVGYIVYKEGRD